MDGEGEVLCVQANERGGWLRQLGCRFQHELLASLGSCSNSNWATVEISKAAKTLCLIGRLSLPEHHL